MFSNSSRNLALGDAGGPSIAGVPLILDLNTDHQSAAEALLQKVRPLFSFLLFPASSSASAFSENPSRAFCWCNCAYLKVLGHPLEACKHLVTV